MTVPSSLRLLADAFALLLGGVVQACAEEIPEPTLVSVNASAVATFPLGRIMKRATRPWPPRCGRCQHGGKMDYG